MSISSRVYSQATFRTDFCIEMWTLGVLKTRFSLHRYCKKQLVTETIFMDPGVNFCRFLDASEAAFLFFVGLEAGLKIDGFSVV